MEMEGTFLYFKVVLFSKMFFSFFSELSKLFQDIEKGIHNDKKCTKYYRDYKEKFHEFHQKNLPNCQFKGNKFKIQNLIRKIKIDLDGNVTEVQFEN